MSFGDEQRWLRDVALAEAPDDRAFARLGGDPARWQVYRRMVRARMAQTIVHAFAGLSALVGEDALQRVVDTFLMHGGPRSPYLRDLPGELLQFLESTANASAMVQAWPAHALDLARYEWALLEVAYDPGRVDASNLRPLVMDAPAVLDPAHRLLHLEYLVHREPEGDPRSAVARGPLWVCLHRHPVTHEVDTLELTEVAAKIVAGVASAPLTLTDVARGAATACGLAVDVAFVEALTELLASFVERGLLLGSRVASETSP